MELYIHGLIYIHIYSWNNHYSLFRFSNNRASSSIQFVFEHTFLLCNIAPVLQFYEYLMTVGVDELSISANIILVCHFNHICLFPVFLPNFSYGLWIKNLLGVSITSYELLVNPGVYIIIENTIVMPVRK